MGTAGAGREQIRPMRACLIKAALPSPFTCPCSLTVSVHSISLIGYPISFLRAWVIVPGSSCCDGNFPRPHVPLSLALVDWISTAPSFNRALDHKQPPKDPKVVLDVVSSTNTP